MRSDEPEKPRDPNAGRRDAAVRQRWTVGAIGVERVVEFELGVPSDEPLPGWIVDGGFSDASGVLVASTAIVVTSAGRTVVVDPWLAFDGDRSDIAAQAGLATATRRKLLAGLAEQGTWLIAPLMGGPGGGVVTPDGATWRLTPRS